MTSASSVDRGRWKFVSKAATRRNVKPGVMKRVVRPVAHRLSDRLEHAHVVVPTRGAAPAIRPPRRLIDLMPLAVEDVLLQERAGDRSKRVETHVQRHADEVEVVERAGREVESRSRSSSRSRLSRVDGLVTLGISKRLVNVGRERRIAVRLAIEVDEPASVAERLEELHRADAFSRAQSTRGARKRFPHALARDGLEEQNLHSSTRGPPKSQPRRHNAAVVDHDELVAEEPWEVREARVLDGGRVTPVHQQPRRVAWLDRLLGDQLRRQVVVELGHVHPPLRVASAPMDSLALERAKQRIADAAAGRPEPAALEAALERSRSQIETLAVAAAELEASIPVQVGSAVRDGLRAEVLPVARHIAEIRGLLNQAIRRLERLEGELLAERHARVDDLALLVDLVSSGWKGVDTRLERLERAQEEAAGSLTRVEAIAMSDAHERVEHAAAA
jgi:hypothetical protein